MTVTTYQQVTPTGPQGDTTWCTCGRSCTGATYTHCIDSQMYFKLVKLYAYEVAETHGSTASQAQLNVLYAQAELRAARDEIARRTGAL